MMLSSTNRLYRKGCTSASVSGPPRLSSSTPTFSAGAARGSAGSAGRPLVPGGAVRLAACSGPVPRPPLGPAPCPLPSAQAQRSAGAAARCAACLAAGVARRQAAGRRARTQCFARGASAPGRSPQQRGWLRSIAAAGLALQPVLRDCVHALRCALRPVHQCPCSFFTRTMWTARADIKLVSNLCLLLSQSTRALVLCWCRVFDQTRRP